MSNLVLEGNKVLYLPFKLWLCTIEWLDRFYPHGGTGANQYKSAEVTKKNLSKMPVSKKESARAKKIKRLEGILLRKNEQFFVTLQKCNRKQLFHK